MYLIFQIISVINGWGISCELALTWTSLDLTDDKSTLVQVMAWCRQATSHYLNQWWTRSRSPYGLTRPQWVNVLNCFYASAFRRRRHYVFGLSVRPSVRPKPEIPSFDLYMGPLVHPTNRNRFTACPSVRPSVRLSVRPSVRLSVRPSGEVSGHLPENAWREWPQIWHADVSWPSTELINLWPRSIDFSNFGAILT